MLGIVLKLSDVGSAVRGPEQVGLRAAPKWTQVLDCGDASLNLEQRYSKFIDFIKLPRVVSIFF